MDEVVAALLAVMLASDVPTKTATARDDAVRR